MIRIRFPNVPLANFPRNAGLATSGKQVIAIVCKNGGVYIAMDGIEDSKFDQRWSAPQFDLSVACYRHDCPVLPEGEPIDRIPRRTFWGKFRQDQFFRYHCGGRRWSA